MKLADAAAEDWSALDEVQAHAPAQRRFDKAGEELKKGPPPHPRHVRLNR